MPGNGHVRCGGRSRETGRARARHRALGRSHDFVAWNGMYGRGRRAIEDGHRPLFAGPLAGSRMVLVGDGADSAPPQSLRFVRPDVAIMVIPSVVTPAGQSPTDPDHESVQTFVLTKNGNRWRVAAFQNTRKPAQG